MLLEQANTRAMTSERKKGMARFERGAAAKRFAKAEFTEGTLYLDLKLSKKELAEGLARDVVRRMQQMRKEMDLKVDSYVHAYLVAPSRAAATLLKGKHNYIAHEVRAKRLKITREPVTVNAPYYTKTWQIDQDKYEFGLCEVSKLKTKASKSYVNS
jgi:hypothetical protein